MLKEEKHIRLNYAKQSIKKILSLIERLQGIKSNCVEMASSKYNINSEEFFDKVFSTTFEAYLCLLKSKIFPLIPS